VLSSLGALVSATLRLWQLQGEQWQLLAGESSHLPPAVAARTDHALRLAIPDADGIYLEVVPHQRLANDDIAGRILPVVQYLVETDRTTTALTGELAARYEEIDLLYSIGELLGRARSVDEVAAIILREITAVLGARWAALRVFDPEQRVLRAVATLGMSEGAVPENVSVDDPAHVVARAFRSAHIETGTEPDWVPGEVAAVPIHHSRVGMPLRVVGTLALADRASGGAFTREEVKLIAAVATQIGSALENARLAAHENERRRLEREMELAHNLQVRLLPTPAVLRDEAEVAVRSQPAESLGGDFYTFARLGRRRIGVMVGDVASHGLSAALIAAQVMAAAGIHAHATSAPDDVLARLADSLADELDHTEMYLTVWYGIVDPIVGRLAYSNAGHIHAFRLPASGAMERLAPTAPPLGMVETRTFGRRTIPWHTAEDLLVLYTDGLVDRTDPAGERYGEARLINWLERERRRPVDALVAGALADVEAFSDVVTDDSTLLIMRI
jgi:phosphoserine phosphatase RsbU/P